MLGRPRAHEHDIGELDERVLAHGGGAGLFRETVGASSVRVVHCDELVGYARRLQEPAVGAGDEPSAVESDA